jgi:trimethylamine monooxygenase
MYKGIFWWSNPKLMYIGIQDQYYTFNMFDAQAWYARDVVLGQMQLPNPGVMIDDIQKWTADEEAVADAFQAIDFQTEYVRDLLKPTDYPHLDVDEVARMFKVWEHHKMENILTYRDKAFKSVLTGTLAPVHHTPWIKALDDSLETYLNQPGTKAAAE